MPLSDASIKAVKPTDKPQKISDGEGMYLFVSPSGGKHWRLDYRFGNKRKTLALGSYPAVSLKTARQSRDEAKVLLAEGHDPGQVKQEKKATLQKKKEDEEAKKEIERIKAIGGALPGSFKEVALEWQTKHFQGKAESHTKKVVSRFENDIFPFLGDLAVDQITPVQILKVCQRIEHRGTIDTAHRAKNNISQVMRYAVAIGKAPRDPVPDLRGALTPQPPKSHYAAPTEPQAVSRLLKMMMEFKGTDVVSSALRLSPLIFVRPGELRHLKWQSIDFEKMEIRFTPTKTQNTTGVDLIIPLSRQAIEILEEIRPITPQSEYVFYGKRDKKRPMSNGAINAALRTLGIDTKTELTGHGFRAMARTLLEEVHDFRPELLELQISHVVRDPLGRAYNRTKHIEKRRVMMQVWADYLDELKEK